MTPAQHVRLALKISFVLTSLLGELELEGVDLLTPLGRAVDGTIIAGAALEELLTSLVKLERQAKFPKPATTRSKIRAREKALSEEKRVLRGSGRRRK